ncbi:hypothetical protein B484DRAFT_461095, partial [Ochromonadaceae sp. CCMP2298]
MEEKGMSGKRKRDCEVKRGEVKVKSNNEKQKGDGKDRGVKKWTPESSELKSLVLESGASSMEREECVIVGLDELHQVSYMCVGLYECLSLRFIAWVCFEYELRTHLLNGEAKKYFVIMDMLYLNANAFMLFTHSKVLFGDETTQDFSLSQLQTLTNESVKNIQDTHLDSDAEKRFWAAENKMDKSSGRKATPKKAKTKKSSPKKAKAKAESQGSEYKGGGKAPKNQLAILPARMRPPESASTSSSTSNLMYHCQGWAYNKVRAYIS